MLRGVRRNSGVWFRLVLGLAAAQLTAAAPAALGLESGPGFSGASAARRPGETEDAAYRRRLSELERSGVPRAAPGESARDAAQPYARADLSRLPEWPDLESARAAFLRIRDERFLRASGRPDFARRIPWLYPDDGCFVRAQTAVERLAGKPLAKLFVFGQLSLRTRFSPSGRVFWWYHVVPAFQVAGKPYVFDPAIDPSGTLALEDWLRRQVADPASTRIAVCDAGSYAPFSRCQAPPPSEAAGRAPGDRLRFLDLEWNRMTALGNDPRKILGDAPPW